MVYDRTKYQNQIRLLTEARDRLLPKLMGGEKEVKSIKILKYGH